MKKSLYVFLSFYGQVVDFLVKLYAIYKTKKISNVIGGGKIGYPFIIKGAENITMDCTSTMGPGATLYTTCARIIIKEHVITGPNLTIITGDHKYMVEKWINEVGVEDKDTENDMDVFIERDVWIGANVTILKGVRIGESAIVAAGALVIHDIPPFSIVAGIPAKVKKMKWAEEDIKKHLIYMNAN